MVTVMKKKKLLNSALCIIISAVFALFALTTVFAYSSDSDPIVTLSYLNDVILPMLREEFSAKQDNTPVIPDETPENPIIPDENPSPDITETNGSINEEAAKLGTYELLELHAGQTVLCESAVEIIVRPGSIVTVVSPFDAQGIADITNGNELLSDTEIPINAYCIIPRGNDGRGFRVISENAYIMIRGEYSIG
jgi:hypothetical protein